MQKYIVELVVELLREWCYLFWKKFAIIDVSIIVKEVNE